MTTEPGTRVPPEPVEPVVMRLLAEILYVEPETLSLDTGFADLGLDSILAVEYLAQLKRELGATETVESLLDLGTPRALAERLRHRTLAG
ncbi:hypothetical protein Sru01_49940 [Sphaerisporangium rufum]|uniref:Carrier domain-containing protein n=1 Tax=Sphaerisporangium rufum TaxID=1381558 RepID=A0A919R5E2_9ACTN|nr:acyl carrier protein [Sphaerisporangium rufum]GII80012.1 hypothetical protein Sru01_49940 [Sphaerisporangium rufum]